MNLVEITINFFYLSSFFPQSINNFMSQEFINSLNAFNAYYCDTSVREIIEDHTINNYLKYVLKEL